MPLTPEQTWGFIVLALTLTVVVSWAVLARGARRDRMSQEWLRRRSERSRRL